MATYNDAMAAIESYRMALMEEQQNEDAGAASRAFSAAGASSAFATPLNNVHATGVGVRVRDGKVKPGEFVIKVFVFEKQDLGSETPDITRGKFQGVEIDVEHLPVQQALAKKKRSAVKRQAASGRKASRRTTPRRHQERRRPVVGGIQIQPLGAGFVGTLGSFVRRVSDGRVFVLSNNHVIADTNRLPLGTRIVQNAGGSSNSFASLSELERIRFPGVGVSPRNTMDAAIAEVTDPSLVRLATMFGISDYDPRLIAARPAMTVTKSGRTTAVTSGRIIATGVNGVQVNYGTRANPIIATFDNCVSVRAASGSFSNPGDSGSVVLDKRSGRPTALLFAGDGVTTTCCDLGAVCARFNVLPA